MYALTVLIGLGISFGVAWGFYISQKNTKERTRRARLLVIASGHASRVLTHCTTICILMFIALLKRFYHHIIHASIQRSYASNIVIFEFLAIQAEFWTMHGYDTFPQFPSPTFLLQDIFKDVLRITVDMSSQAGYNT